MVPNEMVIGQMLGCAFSFYSIYKLTGIIDKQNSYRAKKKDDIDDK